MSMTTAATPEWTTRMVRARTPERARRIVAHELRQEGRRIADVAQCVEQRDGRWLVECSVVGIAAGAHR